MKCVVHGREMAEQKILKLKKGQTLFKEGDRSRAMYYVRSGLIRIFKKKGTGAIEIDTIRTGQILGELAFLDGNPRSASGEALTDCELIEISGPTFTNTLAKAPDWLKLLLKTVVGRLRNASTKIRQLEQTNVAVDYSGSGVKNYVYLGVSDALKAASALLLVAVTSKRSGENSGDPISIARLEKFANQIMGVPVSKVTSFLDVLAQAGYLTMGEASESGAVELKDREFLEKWIGYVNEQNLLSEDKRLIIHNRAFLIMNAIYKHIDQYKPDVSTGKSTVNIAEVLKKETKPEGKAPFRLEEVEELVKINLCGPPAFNSAENCAIEVHNDTFKMLFRYHKVLKSLEYLNEQKRNEKVAA